MIPKTTFLVSLATLGLMASVSAVTVGFGTALPAPVQDTTSDGTTNQMRQNINITNTVFLGPGTYQATTWSYLAAPDSTVPGVTQPVFPFVALMNGIANFTVLAYGATIDTNPGANAGVLFGGANNTFTIGVGGATIAAGMQNTSAPGVQNSIMTDLAFGSTDHANSLNFDQAGSVGATLDTFGHSNLTRTYGFSIEVVPVPEPTSLLFAMSGLAGILLVGMRRRR